LIMSQPRTTDKNNDKHGGGPGSSHQGGSHGHATRSQRLKIIPLLRSP
jgi:hypothetical protein